MAYPNGFFFALLMNAPVALLLCGAISFLPGYIVSIVTVRHADFKP